LSGLERRSPYPQSHTQSASVTPPLIVEKSDRQGLDPYPTKDELETDDALVQQSPPKAVSLAPALISSGSERRDKPALGNKVVGFVIGGVALVVLLIIGGINGWFSPTPTAAPVPRPTTAPTTQSALVNTATSQPTNTAIPATPTGVLATTTQAFGIGSTMISPKDGMVMVYVPAGEFTMGGEYDEHLVYLDSFWIDQTEVTNSMFSTFVSETGYKTDAELGVLAEVCTRGGNSFFCMNSYDISWKQPRGVTSHINGKDNLPVIQVSWNDANAYCNWAGRSLPSEAQWEKAARGVDGRPYPWGLSEPTEGNLANFFSSSLYSVGYFKQGASPYLAYDMAGNVEEWVYDWDGLNQSDRQINPIGPKEGDSRVVKGGSWLDYWGSSIMTYTSHSRTPDQPSNVRGFRCAMDAD